MESLPKFLEILKKMKMFHYSESTPGCVFLHSSPYYLENALLQRDKAYFPLELSKDEAEAFEDEWWANGPIYAADDLPPASVAAFVQKFNDRYEQLWKREETLRHCDSAKARENLEKVTQYIASLGGPNNTGPANVGYGWWYTQASNQFRVTRVFKDFDDNIECTCGGHIPNVFGCFNLEGENCGKLNLDTRYSRDCQAFGYIGQPLRMRRWTEGPENSALHTIEMKDFKEIFTSDTKKWMALIVGYIKMKKSALKYAIYFVRADMSYEQRVYFVKMEGQDITWNTDQKTEYCALGVAYLEYNEKINCYNPKNSDNPAIGANCNDHFSDVFMQNQGKIDFLNPSFITSADEGEKIMFTYVSSSLCAKPGALPFECRGLPTPTGFASKHDPAEDSLIITDVEGYCRIPFGLYDKLYSLISSSPAQRGWNSLPQWLRKAPFI